MGFYPASYGGLTAKEAMYDYEKLAPGVGRFHEDFLPDVQADPISRPRPRPDRHRFITWPGHGMEDDAPWQYVEAEYMKTGDYDALIADPSAYFMRVLLPRFARL